MDRSFDSAGRRKKARLMEESKKKTKRYGGTEEGNQPSLDCSHDNHMHLTNAMVGFDLPNYRPLPRLTRMIPKQHTRPPFFYYENVAELPKVYGRPLQDRCMTFNQSLWILSICVQLQGKEATSIICQLRTENLFMLCLQRPYLRHSLIMRSGGFPIPGIQEHNSTACEYLWKVQG